MTRRRFARAVWHRHYPTARAIAAALQEHAAVLCLPTWRLMLDIRARFGCSESTARMAVCFARRGGAVAHG